MIKIYTSPSCSSCRKVKKWFMDQNIPFIEKNIFVATLNEKELITFIKDNPSVLKRPIIVDDHRIQVGYNPDEIRSFIPHARRLAEWACKNDSCPQFDKCAHFEHANEEN